MTDRSDVAVIGGGLVGLATAYALARRHPEQTITVFEKEKTVAVHQSGRNSGVVHSGVYYKPGSLKAILCREGRSSLQDFCSRESIGFDACGKVIVAVDNSELPGLHAIAERGKANGVSCRLIGPDELRRIEPHVRGVGALHVEDAGIVDFPAVAVRLAELLREKGHNVMTSSEVVALQSGRPGPIPHSGDGVGEQGVDMGDEPRGVQDASLTSRTGQKHRAGLVINCAGLYSDRIARMAGADPGLQIVPFRGVYYELKSASRHLCRNLIYPVPDPAYPFLGVHLTRMIDARVEVGPNAVLATGREGYAVGEGNLKEMVATIGYRGFLRLSSRHWKKGLTEVMQTVSRRVYLRAVQRLVPEIGLNDIVPCRSGIRAQALDKNGNLVEDFVFVDQPGIIHVCNAPSPAATACLAIGEVIADRAEGRVFSGSTSEFAGWTTRY